MSPAAHIALRFTVSRKRSLALSLVGVIFGVAFFILTQAQTQGFEQYFIQTILGTSGAVVITDRFQHRYTSFADGGDRASGPNLRARTQGRRKYYEGITNAAEIMRVARQFSNVSACAPVVQGTVTIRSNFTTEVLNAQGIDLDAQLAATALRSQIISGRIEEYRSSRAGIILGSLLADKLQVAVGDTVQLTGPDPKPRTFAVSAIFRSGNNIIDERRGYIDLRASQVLLKKPGYVSTIIVKLRDPDRAPEMAAHFERLFGHRSRSWQERERGNLQIFSTLRLSAGITVSLIILLAGFLIFNTLTMAVVEKIREIAILRSMGYRRLDISLIFLGQGFVVATIGSLLGAAAGALFTYLVSLIPIKVTGFFYTDRFLVAWSWQHYLGATLIAFVAVLGASFLPARRAANLPPVATLRGSGQ
jgi:lipoprotein-releasing system permease protein